jgi:hypothetical protein
MLGPCQPKKGVVTVERHALLGWKARLKCKFSLVVFVTECKGRDWIEVSNGL